MKDGTMILIEKSTARRIKGVKITKLESYDEIINRLIDDVTKVLQVTP